MSSGPACNCAESKKPIAQRAWVVYNRNCNYSAFNGYHWTFSEYSALHCRACSALWRTKADYVTQIPDGKL